MNQLKALILSGICCGAAINADATLHMDVTVTQENNVEATATQITTEANPVAIHEKYTVHEGQTKVTAELVAEDEETAVVALTIEQPDAPAQNELLEVSYAEQATVTVDASDEEQTKTVTVEVVVTKNN